MKEHKVVIALIIGVLIGLAAAIVHRPCKATKPYDDATVHKYLVEQLQSAPDISKVDTLQMGFDGKSLVAKVVVKESKALAEIDYVLTEGGYYQAQGQWRFDVGPVMKLWPYRIH